MQLVHTLVHGFVRPLEALLGRGDLASGELHEVRQALEAYVLGVESASNVVGCPFVQWLVLLPGSAVENAKRGERVCGRGWAGGGGCVCGVTLCVCVCVCVCVCACVCVCSGDWRSVNQARPKTATSCTNMRMHTHTHTHTHARARARTERERERTYHHHHHCDHHLYYLQTGANPRLEMAFSTSSRRSIEGRRVSAAGTSLQLW